MDDLTHNCPDCHEVTRCPTQHTCGRTPEGTLPGHQPHKPDPYRTTAVRRPAPDMSTVIAGFRNLARELAHLYANSPRKSDYTLAGPRKGD